LYDIVGAEDYNAGKATADQVGIKVIDDKTIQYTLKTPVPYFDYLVSFPTYAPCRQDLYEKYGSKYNTEVENFITNGPFKVSDWKHEAEMDFVKNPDYWDAANIKLEKVTGLMIADDNTEFNMYEAGELDHTIALNADQKSALTKGTVGTYGDGSVWFFDYNCTDPVLKNASIRKALTLAIDRKSFIENVAKQPWKAATS
jgi:oligopeptide transport system substrate-binding protein